MSKRYSESEIVSLYKQAANKQKQIDILCDLACMGKEDVIKLLQKNNLYKYMLREEDMYLRKSEIVNYFANGGTLTELCSRYHTSKTTLKNILHAMDVETPKSRWDKGSTELPEEKEEKEEEPVEVESKKEIEVSGIDPIELTIELGLDFASGSALCYIVKSGISEDKESKYQYLLQAKEYLDQEVKHMEKVCK